MRENLKDYMTEEEQRQIDVLLGKAKERMRKRQVANQEHQFLFLGCQCECYGEMMLQNQEKQKKADFEEDIQKLLKQICGFCKRHRGCFREGEGEEGEGEDEEELPFGGC